MSVYSGFATRPQQSHYDNLIYNLLSTLMVRILKFYRCQQIDEQSFKKIIKKQHKVISKMEKHKYLEPKFASLIVEFANGLIKATQNNRQKDFQNRRKQFDQYDQTPNRFNRTLSGLGKEFSILEVEADQLEQEQNHRQKRVSNLCTHNQNNLCTHNQNNLRTNQNNFRTHKESQKQYLLQKIPQKRSMPKRKKKSQSTNKSIRSNIDIWDMRNQKLPQIPSLHQIQPVNIMNRTKGFSQKVSSIGLNANKTKYPSKDQTNEIDQEDRISELIGGHIHMNDLHQNSKALTRAPKFRAKMFFK